MSMVAVPVAAGGALDRAEVEDGAAPMLLLVAKAVVVLNLIDAVATLVWVHTGIAEEANVLLQGLLESGSLPFMLVKLSLVSLGLVLLWRHRQRGLAVAGLLVAFSVYYALMLVHLHVAGTFLASMLA